MQAVLVGQTNSPKTRGECTQNVCPTLCHSSQHRNFTQTWPHAHMMPFAGTPTTALKPQPALLSNTCMRAMLRIHGTPLHNRCSCQLYSHTSQPCSYLAASTHTRAHTHTQIQLISAQCHPCMCRNTRPIPEAPSNMAALLAQQQTAG